MPSGNWLAQAIAQIEQDGAVVRASLIDVRGSAPREAGAMMLIGRNAIWRTIGGGALEHDIMHHARQMIDDQTALPWDRRVVTAALGPDMGQCCGGHVRVLLERLDDRCGSVLHELAAVMPHRLAHPLGPGTPIIATASDTALGICADSAAVIMTLSDPVRPLFLYGAGHVGRALVGHLPALGLDVHWVDIESARFPPERSPDISTTISSNIPAEVRRVIASDPTIIARHAPSSAFHLVITHSHALDEAICLTVLQQDNFARLGLIGSATKAARFRSRLGRAGVGAASLDRLVCPLGLTAILGKSPPRVALSIAAGVAIWQQECAPA